MLVKMKRLLPLTLALLLTVSPVKASGESLIDPEQLQDQQANFHTTQVRVDSFVKEYTAPAVAYYPLQSDLKLEKNDANFAEFKVIEGQEVKKGDVLATFAVEISDAALESLEREIARLEAETALGISQRNAAIEQLNNAAAEGFEKERNDILLRKAQAELEYYQHLQQRSLESLQQAQKEEQEKHNGYVLTAPEDGKVTNLAKLKTGDLVKAEDVILTLIQTNVVQLRISNSSGDLRYNMPVMVTIGKGETTVVYGRVVAADGAIPAQERTGYAYISVDTEEDLDNPRLTAEVVRLDNVLVADREAVVSENGKHYVTKLVDGMVQKRYIGFGMNNVNDVWLIYGVEAGDTLITD